MLFPRGMEVEGLYAEDGGRSCLSLLSQDVFGHFELCRFLRVNIFWHYGISVGHSPLRRTCLTLCSGAPQAVAAAAHAGQREEE